MEVAEGPSHPTGVVKPAAPETVDVDSDDSLNHKDKAYVARDAGHKLAEKFVSDKGYQLHPIFPSPPPRIERHVELSARSFENQRAEKRDETRSARLRRQNVVGAQTSQFFQVIDVYKKTARGDALPADFDIRGSHSWEEVMLAARNAESKSHHDGSKNLLRKFGRGTQKHANAVRPWLDLIPDGDYTSALCGSLKIAFNIAHRMNEKRTAIIETFHKIPKTIRKAEDRLGEHPDDEVLCDAASELYLAVLKVVEGMIKYLVGKKIGGLLASSEKPIDVGLSEVEEQMEVITNRATTLQNRTINKTDANVEDLKSRAEGMSISTLHTEQMTSNMYPFIGMTYVSVNEVNEKLEASIGMINVLQEHVRKSEWNSKRQAKTYIREIRSLKKDLLKQHQNASGSVREAPTPLQVPSVELPFTQELLESLLEVDPKIAHQDTQRIMQEGYKIKASSQSRGHWLLRNHRFQTWLTVNETRGLVVDGSANGTDKISAMSLVCSLLIQSLKEAPNAIILSFFCGIHTLSSDPLSSVFGLLRSLISQLLQIQDFDLDFLDEEYEDQLHRNNIEYLTDLFRVLVEQFSDDRIVFCIIDGISFYEKTKDMNEVNAVFEILSELASHRVGPLFKLLLTNPLRSRSAKQYFSLDDRVSVPTDAGDGQLLSVNQVMRHTNSSALLRAQASGETDGAPDHDVGSEGSEAEEDYDQGNFSISTG